MLKYISRNKLFIILLSFLAACNGNSDSQSTETTAPVVSNEPPVLSYTVTNIYPHQTSAFTEGLEWHDGKLLESTGDPDYGGKSKLAYVDLKTGNDIKKINLDKQYFGEGCTLLNGKIYMLTYKENKCFVFDAKTLAKLKEFDYDGEGWGLTNNGKQLIMNNGGDKLYFRDPETFAVKNIVSVTDNNGPVAMINELEWVNGELYSNVWQKDIIVKINPETGKVTGKADFSGMKEKYFPELAANTDVLNGIAYDSTAKRFFITGKNWPKLFEVKF
jgi:glutaminyl-peptide cyclotransferase